MEIQYDTMRYLTNMWGVTLKTAISIGKGVQPTDLFVSYFQTRPHYEMIPCPLWIRNTWVFDEIKLLHTIFDKELKDVFFLQKTRFIFSMPLTFPNKNHPH